MSIIIIIMKRIRLQCHKIQRTARTLYKSTHKACIRSRAQAKIRQTQSWRKHRRKSSDLRRRLKASIKNLHCVSSKAFFSALFISLACLLNFHADCFFFLLIFSLLTNLSVLFSNYRYCWISDNLQNQTGTDSSHRVDRMWFWISTKVCSDSIMNHRARQLYKNISMLLLFPVKDGKLSTGVIAIFNASCYGQSSTI